MSASPQPVPYEADAVVAGAGMAGLAAAHTLVGHGLRPLVLESADDVGGLVAAGEIAGVPVDLGAEAFALRRPEVRDLAESLGLPVQSPAGRSWVFTGTDHFPIPTAAILGIPADPGSAELRDALSPDGAARAAADAELDPAVGAEAESLADLVEARMGTEVLDRLVRPIAGGIHAADPADLAVEAVIPGLRTAMTEHGSLAAAIAVLKQRSAAGPAVASTVGGLFRLPRALRAAIEDAGGQVHTATAVHTFAREHGQWIVRVEGGQIRTPRLVIATDGNTAAPLLSELLPGQVPKLPSGAALTHVTLAVEAPALDHAPRGSGLLVAPQAPVRARALTHASAKWPWLAEATGPGKHVLRLSYPGTESDPAQAVADAEHLLGAPITTVLESVTIVRPGALTPTTPAHRTAVAELQERITALPGLAVAGAWVAGTGIAAVVAHAQAGAAAIAQL